MMKDKITQRFDAIVIGGGLIGLTAALAMAKRKFLVAIIDISSFDIKKTMEPRAFAINNLSQNLFQQLKVWQHINPKDFCAYQKMHIWDASTKASIDFDSRMIIQKELGFILEESALKNALLNEVNLEPNITLFPKITIKALKENSSDRDYPFEVEGVIGKIESLIWRSKLGIIADGANSFCRELLKVPLTIWPYHQHALVASIQTQIPHQQTAYQIFNESGALAFLPLAQENHCSIVWSTTSVHAKELLQYPEDVFNQKLETALEHKLGSLKLQGIRLCFPLSMRHVQQYCGANWLLIGDSAHTIHPLAGLGLNVGLADITTWLDCLDQSKNQFTLKALQSYQRQRKNALWQVILLMEGLKTLFLNPSKPLIMLRGLGLNLCNSFLPLKKLFINYASGKL